VMALCDDVPKHVGDLLTSDIQYFMHVKLVVRFKFLSLFIILENFHKRFAHWQSDSTMFYEVCTSVCMPSKSVLLLVFIAISFT